MGAVKTVKNRKEKNKEKNTNKLFKYIITEIYIVDRQKIQRGSLSGAQITKLARSQKI